MLAADGPPPWRTVKTVHRRAMAASDLTLLTEQRDDATAAARHHAQAACRDRCCAHGGAAV